MPSVTLPCFFPCLAFIIIKTTVHIYFPVYCLLLPARRKLQRAVEHSAQNLVEEMDGVAQEPRFELCSEPGNLCDQRLIKKGALEGGPLVKSQVGPSGDEEGHNN